MALSDPPSRKKVKMPITIVNDDGHPPAAHGCRRGACGIARSGINCGHWDANWLRLPSGRGRRKFTPEVVGGSIFFKKKWNPEHKLCLSKKVMHLAEYILALLLCHASTYAHTLPMGRSDRSLIQCKWPIKHLHEFVPKLQGQAAPEVYVSDQFPIHCPTTLWHSASKSTS